MFPDLAKLSTRDEIFSPKCLWPNYQGNICASTCIPVYLYTCIPVHLYLYTCTSLNRLVGVVLFP